MPSSSDREQKRPSFRAALLERRATEQAMMAKVILSSDDTEGSEESSSSTSFSTGVNNTSRSVRFSSSILIHEHGMILGDNPAVGEGLPLTITWERQRRKKYSLDEYEERKVKRNRNRNRNRQAEEQAKSKKGGRCSHHFKLGVERRAELAMIGGCSLEDMGNTVAQIKEIQKERVKSGKKSNWELLKEGFSGGSSKVKGGSSIGAKQRSSLTMPKLFGSAPAAA